MLDALQIPRISPVTSFAGRAGTFLAVTSNTDLFPQARPALLNSIP